MRRTHRGWGSWRVIALAGACALITFGALVFARQAEGRSVPGAFSSVPTRHVSLWYQAGVKPGLAARVAASLERLRMSIGRDFGVYPPRLQVRMYVTHAGFAGALWRMQRQRPQTLADNASRIVHGTLLLGPLPAAYVWHDLPHEYTEWVLDRLTQNHADALPDNTWLYDGLAEYEAYRYAAAGFRCAGGAGAPFDVTRVRSPRQWMQIRRGPLGSLEYCLAYLAVRHLVSRLGWGSLVQQLHGPDVWTKGADRLARQARSEAVRPRALVLFLH